MFISSNLLLLDGVYTEHILACIDWYLRLENYNGSVINGKATMLFHDRLYELSGSASFTPYIKYVFSKIEMGGLQVALFFSKHNFLPTL